MTPLTVKRQFHVRRGRRSRKELAPGPAPPAPPAPEARVPRVAKLMALAIRFDELIRSGAVKDQAELARVGRVSRARVTQVMNLLNLAPDIQEEILFLKHASAGRIAVTERGLRRIAATVDWSQQRAMWTSDISRPIATPSAYSIG